MRARLMTGLIAIAAASTALANDPVEKPKSTMAPATFESLDINRDGRISATEARTHRDLSAAYRDAVTDADKGMSKSEFDSWAASRANKSTAPRSTTPDASSPTTTTPKATETPSPRQ